MLIKLVMLILKNIRSLINTYIYIFIVVLVSKYSMLQVLYQSVVFNRLQKTTHISLIYQFNSVPFLLILVQTTT